MGNAYFYAGRSEKRLGLARMILKISTLFVLTISIVSPLTLASVGSDVLHFQKNHSRRPVEHLIYEAVHRAVQTTILNSLWYYFRVKS